MSEPFSGGDGRRPVLDFSGREHCQAGGQRAIIPGRIEAAISKNAIRFAEGEIHDASA
jgi:hypothetical protein